MTKQPVFVGYNKMGELEPVVEFQYPEDDEYLLKAVNKKKALLEIINFMLSEIMTSHNPRNYIAALSIAAGIDMTPYCKTNTTSKIAFQLGVSQQTFSKQVNRLRKKFGFPKRRRH